MKSEIEKLIKKVVLEDKNSNSPDLSAGSDSSTRSDSSAESDLNFVIEHPADLQHGDYSTNVAMVLAKKLNKNPRELAQEIVKNLNAEISKNPDASQASDIEKIEIAGPGFINFYLSRKFFKKSIQQILNGETNYGRNNDLKGKNIIVEYTDPNPFKQFHIGHLMPNTIGESIARILEWNGANITRVCYQGDVGMHVAKALWGMKKNLQKMPNDSATMSEKISFLGEAYVFGSEKYETDDVIKAEVNEINKKVYELFDDTKSNDDPEIKNLYNKGREWSLIHFGQMYEKLGTTFDHFIFEHQVSKIGSKIVRENVPEIFELSDGAVVYRGEKDGLHTRVFINSMGLPTYEAKDIGLAYYKHSELAEKVLSKKPKTGTEDISKLIKNVSEKFDASIIVTANEQKDYYKVVRAAMKKLNPEIAENTVHITHGMLRFADGKMSSRKGNIITAEELLTDIENLVSEKLQDQLEKISSDDFEKTKNTIAVSSIKYTILKQSIGRDIVFDKNSAVSFEGDSGPYLQYTYVRAKSIIEKAQEKNLIFIESQEPENWQTTDLEKVLYRLPESIRDAYSELGPQYIVTLLTKICAEFNSFYGKQIILDGTQAESYKLAITKATMHVIQNGLKVLGIRVPNRM
ncbi:MAG TPA: arginine--tRNA ligase [Candidatus Paceibacterota bacterium]|nr:arginine--tRNA ligase [Candidatus Paceibacterota bacterium]